MPSPPCKERSQTAYKSHADQYNLDATASFGLAVVKKPQFGIELPVTRPFPTKQQPHKPQDEQNRGKQQSYFRVSLRPLEMRFSHAVYSLVYVSNAIRHSHKP